MNPGQAIDKKKTIAKTYKSITFTLPTVSIGQLKSDI